MIILSLLSLVSLTVAADDVAANLTIKQLGTSGLRELWSKPSQGGLWKSFVHSSTEIGSDMKFTIFFPPKVVSGESKAAVLYWLPGWSFDEKTFMSYSNIDTYAAKYNIIVVGTDSSPRHNVPMANSMFPMMPMMSMNPMMSMMTNMMPKIPQLVGEASGWYVDATQPPWNRNFRMHSYVTKELPALIEREFSDYVIPGRKSVIGHSMGGHGSIMLTLKHPGLYRSSSAFAPSLNPSFFNWQPFTAYLGMNRQSWQEWDSTYLVQRYSGPDPHILIDQGSADPLLMMLRGQTFLQAANQNGVPINYRLQPGKGHINVVAPNIEDHIRHHAKYLYDN